jgi:hypothetical protein
VTTMASLQDRFRTLDHAQAPDLWPEVVERVSTGAARGLPGQASGVPAIRMVILIAALLVVATLAAVAVGTLLRTDRNEPEPFAFMGPISVCNEGELSDEVVLAVRSHAASDPGPQPAELTIYDDGRAIWGPSAQWGGSFNTIDATWSERQLNQDAVAPLIESLTGSLPECRSFASDNYTTIIARSGGDVRFVSIGPDLPFETHIASEQETAAIEALLSRLADPDLGLPASDWDGDGWTESVPDRWRISVSTSPLAERDYPSAEELVMPGGSSLRDFGADRSEADAMGARCVVVSAAEADEVASVLTAAMDAAGREAGWLWSFADDEGYVHLTMAGLLPHEPECEMDPPFEAEETPPAAPAAPATGEGVFGDACDYLDPLAVGAALGEMGDVEHHVAWRADWHMCWYPIAGSSAVVLTSGRRSVPAEHAAEQARLLLGEIGLVEEIAGRLMYFNACTDAESGCRSAIAVAADPHFVLVTWIGGDWETLRRFAEHVVQTVHAGG